MGMQKYIVSCDTLYQKTSLNLRQIVIVSNFSVFFSGVSSNALSFYESKMILYRPNHFV